MTEPAEILKYTAAVVPSYNAARHLEAVLGELAKIIPPLRIIVVDDGSTDDTYRVASRCGVQVIQHLENRGKGAALATGFVKAGRMGMRHVVVLDADGQHNPAEIPDFAAKVALTGADIVVGNRLGATSTMPWLRIMTNRLTSWVVSRFARQRIPDSQNGFRIMSIAVLDKIQLETTRYETESEILIKAGKAGAKIESITVETIYGEEKSSINPFLDTLRFFRLVVKALFW